MNPSSFLRTSSIIFFAMIMGMIIFCGVAFVVNQENVFFMIPGVDDPFVIIVPVALAAGMGMGNFIFQKLITPAKGDKPLQQKISIYMSTSIIRYALTEGPVLIAIIGFLLSSNSFYLIFAGIGILYFLTLKPNPEKIAKTLSLTYEQREELGMK